MTWTYEKATHLRKRARLAFFLVVAVVLSATALYLHLGLDRPQKYLTGAVYYLWYPQNFRLGYLRGRLDPPQPPSLGLYDSADPKVAQQHIAWCSAHGLDFLAVDWWPRDKKQYEVLQKGLLSAPNLGDIKFCLFYETWQLEFKRGVTYFTPKTSRQFVDDLTTAAETLFKHPNYLRVKGRPVLFLYLTRTFWGDYPQALEKLREELGARGHNPFIIGDEVFWQVIAAPGPDDPNPPAEPKPTSEPQVDRMRLFDAVTAYNMYEGGKPTHAGYGADSAYAIEVRGKFQDYIRALKDTKVGFVPSLIPGYNDRGVRHGSRHYVIPRKWQAGAAEGSFLAQCFERIIPQTLDPRLNMILLTSFNEWNEDTQIEPVNPAPAPAATSDDIFTCGYAYPGYGPAYLETVRDLVCAAWGRVSDAQGRPAPGVEVLAWQGGNLKVRGKSDSQGIYTISRLGFEPGQIEIGLGEDGPRQTVEIKAGSGAMKMDLTTQESKP